MQARPLNLSSFEPYFISSPFSSELNNRVPVEYHDHPEFGSIPYNSGLDSAIELIDRRTEYSRSFIKAGTDGSTIYSQKGYFPLHYLDNQGRWMTYDSRLHPSSNQQNLFEAPHQYSPVSVNVGGLYTTIRNGQHSIRFNNSLELFYQDSLGNRTSLGTCSWTNYTAGSEGIHISNAWQGIDIEILVSDGTIKTNYLVNSPTLYTSGFLVFVDHLDVGAGCSVQFVSQNLDAWGNNVSSREIIGSDGLQKFLIGEALGYDQSNNRA
jgi:hypothetical protein